MFLQDQCSYRSIAPALKDCVIQTSPDQISTWIRHETKYCVANMRTLKLTVLQSTWFRATRRPLLVIAMEPWSHNIGMMHQRGLKKADASSTSCPR